jgi:hypothetical protein
VTDARSNPDFERAARVTPDQRLTTAIADSLGATIEPVRKPLRPAWRALVLLGASAFIALAAGALTGLDGIRAQSTVSAAALLLALCVLGWLSARELATQMTPGSRHRLRPGLRFGLMAAMLAGTYLALFHGLGIDQFVAAGSRCLITGLLVAVPTSAIVGFLIRRGCVTQGFGAGLAIGSLSGLAGVGMLTLHCPNLELPHLLWHTMVVVVSGLVGGAAGSIFVPGAGRR